MANSILHAALPFPIRQARFTVLVPYLDADGDPLDPTTPDTEFSLDAGSFADTAEEVTTLTGSRGMGYITLSGAETNGAAVALWAGVASGPKATLMTLYPRVLPTLETGTAQAGAAGTITLAAGAAAYSLIGCIVQTTGGTGGGGTGGANNQARVITAYNTSTKVATVVPNWETTPDGTTTYNILMTDMAGNAILGRFLRPTVDERTLDVTATGAAGIDWGNVENPTTTVGLTGTTVDLVANAVDSTAIATGAITNAKFAAGAIDAAALAADAGTEIRSLASGTSDSGTTTTMVDAARTEADTDYWKGSYIVFTSGNILGQARQITAFTPASDTITFSPATTQAVGTQTYEIWPSGAADVRLWNGTAPSNLIAGRVDANTQAFAANVIDAASIANGAIDAATFAAGAIDATAIANGAIDAATFAAGAIDAAAIADGAIDAATFAANAITATAIATDAITAAKIANGAIDAATFAAGAIDAAAIATDAIDADALAANALAEIKTQIVAALDTDTYAEPAQGTPGATITLAQKIGFLYKFLRNRVTSTSTTISVYNDDAATVDHKSTHSDDSTTYTRGEFTTGP